MAGAARWASNDALLRQVRDFLESNAEHDVDVTWEVRQ